MSGMEFVHELHPRAHEQWPFHFWMAPRGVERVGPKEQELRFVFPWPVYFLDPFMGLRLL